MRTHTLMALLSCFSVSCGQQENMAFTTSSDEEVQPTAYSDYPVDNGIYDGDVEPEPEPTPAPSPGAGERTRRAETASVLSMIGTRGEGASGGVAELFAEGDGNFQDLEEALYGGEEPQTRSWFPETFLFEPQIITDEDGHASVTVTVPDRLTSWRVLGLAHAKSGALAGDVTTFLGTLPVYVDPVVPPTLRAGDRLQLPVQVVNTTAQPVSTTLTMSTDGPNGYIQSLANGAESIQVPAMRNLVRTAELHAERPGDLRVTAVLAGTDAVERVIDIQPTGRPIVTEHSGALAAPKTVEMSGGTDAIAGSTRARLVIYPGALAVLRSELSRVSDRSGTANVAYALLLSGQAPGLLATLDGEVDEDFLRDLRLVSTQRALRASRNPGLGGNAPQDTDTLTLLAPGALANPDDPVLQRMGMRMVDQLVSMQRPDGTFSGGSGWTVQRLLVATADAASTLSAALPLIEDNSRRQSVRRALLMASSAYERLSPQTQNPYMAAAILAAGNVEGTLADDLRAQVRDAVIERDGVRVLPVLEGTLRTDGSTPSEIEATALAAIALRDDPEAAAWIADLGASVIASYSPGRGWGDGRASIAGLRAVIALFDAPLPDELQITLSMDGTVITEGSYNREKLKEILILDAIGIDAAGTHAFEVRAEPAVPGLGFMLSLESRVPWEEPAPNQGLELTLDFPDQLIAGQAANLSLSAAAPSGMPFTIEQNLPAGVQADENSLTALVSSGALRSFETEDGRIRMLANALEPGEALSIQYDVIPTLAGALQSGALSIYPNAQESLAVHYPPTTWRIQ